MMKSVDNGIFDFLHEIDSHNSSKVSITSLSLVIIIAKLFFMRRKYGIIYEGT